MFLIKWTKGRWRNWIDVIPAYWSQMEGDIGTSQHISVHPQKSGPIECACAITTRATEMKLAYSGDNKVNSRNGVVSGITKLIFDDDRRLNIKQIELGGQDEDFEKAAAELFPIEEYEALEGAPGLASHLRRERDPLLRRLKIEQSRSMPGGLACEVCEAKPSDQYHNIEGDFFEIHHIRPLNEGERVVRLEDLAVLCANCHRMVHRSQSLASITVFRDNHIVTTKRPSS